MIVLLALLAARYRPAEALEQHVNAVLCGSLKHQGKYSRAGTSSDSMKVEM